MAALLCLRLPEQCGSNPLFTATGAVWQNSSVYGYWSSVAAILCLPLLEQCGSTPLFTATRAVWQQSSIYGYTGAMWQQSSVFIPLPDTILRWVRSAWPFTHWASTDTVLSWAWTPYWLLWVHTVRSVRNNRDRNLMKILWFKKNYKIVWFSEENEINIKNVRILLQELKCNILNKHVNAI